MDEAWADGLKSLVDHRQCVKYKSTTIKTSSPARMATSSRGRWIGAYSIGLTILESSVVQIRRRRWWWKPLDLALPPFCHYQGKPRQVWVLSMTIPIQCKNWSKMVEKIEASCSFLFPHTKPFNNNNTYFSCRKRRSKCEFILMDSLHLRILHAILH